MFSEIFYTQLRVCLYYKALSSRLNILLMETNLCFLYGQRYIFLRTDTLAAIKR